MSAARPFSFRWVVLSMVIFVVTEIILGGLIANVFIPSHSTRFLVQGVLNLASYFIGGVIIGVISPGLRIREPAIGAFCAVALMLSLSLFTPFSFIAFSMTKMLVGGIIAFFLALSGAELGERLTGNRV